LNGVTSTYVVVHEMGHNMGLNHANMAETPTFAASRDYANVYDIMGSAVLIASEKSCFMAGYQDGIGWLAPNNKVTYPIDAYAPGANTPAWVADYLLAGTPMGQT
jgi:hypothetical protein